MIKKNIIINNLNIIYYISDTFDPDNALVFLHGWQSTSMLFKNILEHCQNYVAIELPGFNGSEISDHPWKLDDYVNFLRDFITKLNIKNPTLIGHSFGGNIILKYLIKNMPARQVVLVDASGVRKKTTKIRAYYVASKLIKIFYIIPGVKKLVEKNKKHFYKLINSEDYVNAGKLKETYQNIINEDLTSELSKINTEAHIIWGDKDEESPIDQAQILKKNIKNSKLDIIKNAGHFSFLDNPAEFNKIFFDIIKC